MRCLSEDMECKQWSHSGPSTITFCFADSHHSYVWGDNVAKAKTQCESLDYLFQLAVEMHKLGLPWVK